MWWMCAQYFVIYSCDYIPRAIDMCIWRKFDCMYVVAKPSVSLSIFNPTYNCMASKLIY